jgi:hypothetical protein
MSTLRGLALLAVLALVGCELQQVSLADVGDEVIAEVILEAGAPRQLALLHRTLGTGETVRVDGAIIEIRDATGASLPFGPVDDDVCLDIDADRIGVTVGSCYGSPLGASYSVVPEATYSLAITLPDGGRLEGRTTLPAPFEVVSPAAVRCAVPVDSAFELVWTKSPGAWVYVVETSLIGIRAALAADGIPVARDPLRLFGLSITAEDTTLVFPTEIGPFDRADPEIGPVLLRIRDGLPPGVAADLTVSAADRNYVNWVRGGNFNPSGMIRIPSVSGDGTGVFGSLVPVHRRIESRPDGQLERCR